MLSKKSGVVITGGVSWDISGDDAVSLLGEGVVTDWSSLAVSLSVAFPGDLLLPGELPCLVPPPLFSGADRAAK